MNLSNRLTFSLVSLVVLLALGLVLGTVSVMAHDDGDSDSSHTAEGADNHVLVESFTVDKSYLTLENKIIATVTFAAAVDAVADANNADPVVTRVHGIEDPSNFTASHIFIELKGAPVDGEDTFTPASGALTIENVVEHTEASEGVGAVYRVYIDTPSGTPDDGEYRLSVQRFSFVVKS